MRNLPSTELSFEKNQNLEWCKEFPLITSAQVTDFKPVPLKAGEDEDYMLALKQEMRGTMQRLPHNIKSHSKTAGEDESALET